MNMNVKSTFDLHRFSSHKVMFAFSLLLVSLLAFSPFTPVFTSVSPFVSGAPDKTVGNESELRDAVNKATRPTVISLDKDISLSEGSLIISANKDITLTSNRENGFYQLIGAFDDAPYYSVNSATVRVEEGGVLRLDGIIVTHTKGIEGTGVSILFGGTCILLSGKISGNTMCTVYYSPSIWQSGYGGGVINSGVFEMFGGEISDNIANKGGGVYNRGDFVMSGGVISDNGAHYVGRLESNDGPFAGGGVYNDDRGGIFTMTGGTISGNTASDSGGGVYDSGTFNRSGGIISGNTSTKYDDIYSRNGVGELPDGDGGSSNGTGELFDGNGFSLRDVMIICVGIVVLMVGVVAGVLFYVKSRVVK
jgi:hypothetical protein